MLIAHSRGFIENMVSIVSPVDLESIYVAVNIAFIDYMNFYKEKGVMN